MKIRYPFRVFKTSQKASLQTEISKKAAYKSIRSSVTIVPNPKYDDDYRNVIETNKWLLCIVGSWPSQSAGLNTFFRILNVIQCIMMINFIIPYFLDGLYNKPEFTAGQKLMQHGYALLFCNYFLKYIVLMVQPANLRACVDQLQSEWYYIIKGSRDAMLENANFGRNVTWTNIGIIFIVAFFWQILALSRTIVVDNQSYHQLAYPAYYKSFDVRVTPYYYYVFLFQLCNVIIFSATVCNTCIAVILTTHVVGQCKILTKIVRDIETKENQAENETVDIELTRIVKKHYDILRFTSNIDSTFRWLFFVEWFNCLAGVCLISYIFVTEKTGLLYRLKNLFVLPIYSYSFIICCYIGEQLINQCENLADAAYMSHWYKLSKKNVFYIFMINSTYKFPTKLMAGKFMILCLSTCSEVLKKSMAFFSVLRSAM